MKTYAEPMKSHFAHLLARREAALRTLLRETERLVDEAEEATRGEVRDFKDVAAEQTLSEVEGVQLDHAAHELQLVLAAQRRLGDDSFGACQKCGKAIDLRRLEAVPAAPMCASCQTLLEKTQSRTST